MKKIIFLILMMSVFLLVGCNEHTTEQEEDPVDIPYVPEYADILDTFWEKYLIEATYQNVEFSENIEDIKIIGKYRYVKGFEDYMTRFFFGDEATFYQLNAIITFSDITGVNPQHFTYKWEDKLFFERRYKDDSGSLEILEVDIDINSYIDALRVDVQETINLHETNSANLMTEESVMNHKYYEDDYDVEFFNTYAKHILEIVEIDQVLYFVLEDYAVVFGYRGTDSYDTITIQSEVKSKPVKEIYQAAFRDSKLQELVIPNTIEIIGQESFAYATCLDLSFEENSQLKTISYRAFYQSSFREIIIPISVTNIADEGFELSSQLFRVYVEAAEKPDGWSEYWINEGHLVEWNYLQ